MREPSFQEEETKGSQQGGHEGLAAPRGLPVFIWGERRASPIRIGAKKVKMEGISDRSESGYVKTMACRYSLRNPERDGGGKIVETGGSRRG